MHQNYTEIAFVLDRSGSMESCRQEAIDGFNLFLQEQQQSSVRARFTLILFDDEYLVPINALPVAEMLPLRARDFVPRGSTALLDAIGRTIDDLGARLAALAETERPAQVVVAIVTDGAENSSQKYTWREIARLIKQQTEQYQWTFLFLGANQDAIATAAQMNIPAANAAIYVADAAGLRASSKSLGKKIRCLCHVAEGIATPVETEIATAMMTDLLAKEEAKIRKRDATK